MYIYCIWRRNGRHYYTYRPFALRTSPLCANAYTIQYVLHIKLLRWTWTWTWCKHGHQYLSYTHIAFLLLSFSTFFFRTLCDWWFSLRWLFYTKILKKHFHKFYELIFVVQNIWYSCYMFFFCILFISFQIDSNWFEQCFNKLLNVVIYLYIANVNCIYRQ